MVVSRWRWWLAGGDDYEKVSSFGEVAKDVMWQLFQLREGKVTWREDVNHVGSLWYGGDVAVVVW